MQYCPSINHGALIESFSHTNKNRCLKKSKIKIIEIKYCENSGNKNKYGKKISYKIFRKTNETNFMLCEFKTLWLTPTIEIIGVSLASCLAHSTFKIDYRNSF